MVKPLFGVASLLVVVAILPVAVIAFTAPASPPPASRAVVRAISSREVAAQ